MSWFSTNIVYAIFTVVITLIAMFIIRIRSIYKYWNNRGLMSKPAVFPYGNFFEVMTQKESIADFNKNIYDYLRTRNQRHGGYYILWMPVYCPIDPNIIKRILVTDFDHFVDRGIYFNEKTDPLSANLLALEGNRWRNLRAKLTPTFTSGKMKMMFSTLVKCSEQLIDVLNEGIGNGPLDIKDITERFGMEIIGSCAFGIDSNSIKNPDNEFSKYGHAVFQSTLKQSLVQFLCFVAPETMKKFGAVVVKPELSKFFMRVIKETVDYREKNNIVRNDFMHLLLQLKNRGKIDDVDSLDRDDKITEENQFSFNELAAQSFLFFIGGFETSSTTITFCLYELALNQNIQDKLRNEINKVLERYDGDLVYEALYEMVYLDNVINETLRKYPPIPILTRICTNSYKIPDTDLILEKGTQVFIPIIGLHYDPEYYPEPLKFDPERFSDKNRNERPSGVFMPFGDGPRTCIGTFSNRISTGIKAFCSANTGMRFGIMEVKVGLIYLLRNYKFTINSKTQIPLEFNPKSFTLSAKYDILLDYFRV